VIASRCISEMRATISLSSSKAPDRKRNLPGIRYDESKDDKQDQPRLRNDLKIVLRKGALDYRSSARSGGCDLALLLQQRSGEPVNSKMIKPSRPQGRGGGDRYPNEARGGVTISTCSSALAEILCKREQRNMFECPCPKARMDRSDPEPLSQQQPVSLPRHPGYDA
jgi:hypothetical protein